MPRLFHHLLALVLTLALVAGPGPAAALRDPAPAPDLGAALCEAAALQAAHEFGVPADILGGLTLTETGRRLHGRLRPWAWSVNAEGAGSWFEDPASALAFAQERVEMGRPNVDIGCFQINFRWHGEQFPSVAAMFDPLQNARYAARFVRDLHAEMGDWRRAAGAFHSRSSPQAQRYLARFDDLRATFRQHGFAGMEGGPGTYNDFADAAPMPAEKVERARQMLTLLGAPLGTGLTGMAGSLAVIGDGGGTLFAAEPVRVAAAGARRGSLFAADAAAWVHPPASAAPAPAPDAVELAAWPVDAVADDGLRAVADPVPGLLD